MGYQWQYSKPGVGRPVPNFAHPLWRGCLFAATVGSSRGHRVIAGPAYSGDLNDRFYPGGAGVNNGEGSRSTVFTTGGFTPNGVCWQSWHGGRGFDNGDGATSNNIQGWNDALPPTIPGVGTGNRYDLPQLGATPIAGCTWAVIIRPDALQTNGQIPFFKRRAQPYGAAQPGWHWAGHAGNAYRIDISDGVTAIGRNSVTTQDPTGARADLLVARYIAVPGSATNSRLELYVNGVAEAGVAGSPSFATVAIGNPAGEDIKILGYGPLNEQFQGEIPFAAFWGRPLSGAEINQLYTDPFIMWRWLNQQQAIIGASGPGLDNPIVRRGVIGAASPRLTTSQIIALTNLSTLPVKGVIPPPMPPAPILGLPAIPPPAPVIGTAMGNCCCCAGAAVSLF